jgi:formylglycine-generating enzyme required for sulfatase activity
MGQDGGAEGSGPSRHVNIPWSYWLGKYEVTAQQYCDFLNAVLVAGIIERADTTAVYSKMGAQVMPHLGGRYLMLNIGDDYDIRWNVNNFEVVGALTNYPVRVTWYGAMMFAHFYGYDLPTEAEWEKAARGPDNDDQDEHMLYPWGNTISAANANYTGRVTKPVGYYDGNQTPIGGDMVNGYGLYDVIGNVAEWTLTTSGYSAESYPQLESLVADRNMPAYGVSESSICRGSSRL